MVTPAERSNASTCADFPAPALLLSVVALESVASRAVEFKIGETPCSDELDVKVIELTGDIVSGDGNRLMTPFGANFKCDDHIGDCDPQSAQISLSRKGLPLGWARDLMRQDNESLAPKDRVLHCVYGNLTRTLHRMTPTDTEVRSGSNTGNPNLP